MKKRYTLLISTVLLTFLLSLILPACAAEEPAPAEREVINLRVIAAFPEANVENLIMKELFCEEVSEQVMETTKDYKVEWEYLLGGAVCKPPEALEAIGSGLGDVGSIITVFYLKKLQLQQFTSNTPFGPSDAALMYRALNRTIDEYPIHNELLEREYNQKVVAWLAKGTYQLVSNFPIRTVEDLEGHKMAHGGPMIPWLTALGSVGVKWTFLEAYTSLQTGVVDGTTSFPDGILGFKMHEVAPYYTQVDFGAPAMSLITINLDTFNSLPAEVQEIVLKVSQECQMKAAEYMTKVENDSIEAIREAGTEMYVLPQDEKIRWAKILDEAGIAKKFCEEADAAGLPGTEVMHAYIRNCEIEGYKWPVVPTID